MGAGIERPEIAMHIGIAFDVKPETPRQPGAPDDLYEEFDAPSTIHAIANVLKGLGHDVSLLGDGRPFLEAMLKQMPDFVFNFAEGTGVSRSREARVPAVCEMLEVPYSGSDPLTQAMALDKDICRRLAESAGVVVPKGFVLNLPSHYDGSFAEFPAVLQGLQLPVIAKPSCEGSSKGIRNRCLIQRPEEFGPTVVELARVYQQPVLVEEFIPGEEVTVGIIGNSPPQILGVMSINPRIKTEHFVYSLEVKRDFRNRVDYTCPAKLPQSTIRALEQAALTMFDVLGCRDVARMDFRLKDHEPYFLEINPLPGLNPESSDLVIMANLLGISHTDLVTRIVNAALKRAGLS